MWVESLPPSTPFPLSWGGGGGEGMWVEWLPLSMPSLSPVGEEGVGLWDE